MPVNLFAARCLFSVSVERHGQAQANHLDLDLPTGVGDGISWAVTVRRDHDFAGLNENRWSGARHRRSFHGHGFEVVFSSRSATARYHPRKRGAAWAAVQLAVFGALHREGTADLHASAIVPPASGSAIVLVGESGHGKSTLTLSAIGAGWGFLSDDLIAVFVDAAGELALAPLRRTLRVAESAVSLLPESARAGRWSADSPRKMIVDPETCDLGTRHSIARPGRLIFLERGDAKHLRRIPRGNAFERLMLHSPHITSDPDAKPAIEALRRLANEVPASVASLPLDSLSDAQTLEDFLA